MLRLTEDGRVGRGLLAVDCCLAFLEPVDARCFLLNNAYAHKQPWLVLNTTVIYNDAQEKPER